MNKFDLINKVLMSDLQAEDKCLLIELITRSDDNGKSWPSVQRLCKARGIRYTKNFKGADHYLPGLVTKTKQGRKNVYVINTPAVAGLSEVEVTIKHTPALEGVSAVNTPSRPDNTPAVEGSNTPAVADNTPSTEGANSTSNTTEDTSKKSTSTVADAPVLDTSLNLKLEDGLEPSLNRKQAPVLLSDSSTENTPATEGVLADRWKRASNYLKEQRERALSTVPEIKEEW